MTWTYDATQLEGNELYQARFLIGDTDGGNPLVEDEEIQWVLTQYPNVFEASATLAEGLAAKFTSEVDVTADGLSYSARQLGENFRALAESLREEANRVHRLGLPYIGGISWRERERDDQDDDLIKTSFRTPDLHDHPQTSKSSNLRSDQS